MALGRVVIATSDEWIAKLIEAPLIEGGAQVVLLQTAEQVLAAIRELPASVVVFDVGLPDHDGAWLAEEIRATDKGRATALLLLSNPADDMRRVEALRAGADASLLKPFRVEEAIQQIASLAALVDRSSGKHRAFKDAFAPVTPVPPQASFEGNVADLSLPTVLTLLEMERRTGTLRVQGAKHSATIELQGGAPIRATLGGADVAPIAVMRKVLRWKSGRFTFSVGLTMAPPDDRHSVGALLIEAARLDDESPPSSLETMAPPPMIAPSIRPRVAEQLAPFNGDEPPTKKRTDPPSSRRAPPKRPLPPKPPIPVRPPPPPKPRAVTGIDDLESELRNERPAQSPPMLEPSNRAESSPRLPPRPAPRPTASSDGDKKR